MTKIYSHGDCEYYTEKYDECRKFHESNMSRRVKLCECPMRRGNIE